eukprot:gene15552-18771_t
MNPIKTLFVIAALTVSSLAMAEGGGDRAFARMEAARNNSMESKPSQIDGPQELLNSLLRSQADRNVITVVVQMWQFLSSLAVRTRF